MENRLDITRGSCPCERGDSFSRPMWRTPQIRAKPRNDLYLFSTKPTKLPFCSAHEPKDDIRNVARRQ